MLRDREDILVSAAAMSITIRWSSGFFAQAEHLGERVRGLERGDDTFELAAELEGIKRLRVGRGEIGHAAGILEPGMLGPDAGIVEAG
jgi:hypothetical protein